MTIDAVNNMYLFLLTIENNRLNGADINKFYREYPDNKKIFQLLKCEIICNHASVLGRLKWIADESVPGKGYILAHFPGINDKYFQSLV